MNTDTQTEIISNGSKWAGEAPDTIEQLLSVLETETLDRSFEAFGNFIMHAPKNCGGKLIRTAEHVEFWGNFFTVSHVFQIHTNDRALIAALTKAIRANQKRADYLAQPDYATVQAERAAADEARRVKRQLQREAEARAILGIKA